MQHQAEGSGQTLKHPKKLRWNESQGEMRTQIKQGKIKIVEYEDSKTNGQFINKQMQRSQLSPIVLKNARSPVKSGMNKMTG
jgi:hypothetical protein